MFGIGLPELGVILVIALVIFGPGKLPSIGKAVGNALGEFKKAASDMQNEITAPLEEKKVEEKKVEDKKTEEKPKNV